MRRVPPSCALAALLLGACHAGVTTAGDGGDNVQMTVGDAGGGKDNVSIKVPGFAANVSLPTLNLGGHLQIDDLKFAPETAVHGVDVNGDKDAGAGEGKVRIAFTNPKAPDALIDYYRKALVDAGYTLGAVGGDTLLATKADKSFTLALTPDTAGTSGTIDITDKH